jgi:hypothetical protein
MNRLVLIISCASCAVEATGIPALSNVTVALFLFLAECDICDGFTNVVKASHCVSSRSSVPTGNTLRGVHNTALIKCIRIAAMLG